MAWHMILMALVYILAGFMHFINPKMYQSITPKWVPYPQQVNMLVGCLEVILGGMLFLPDFRIYGLIGLMILLVLVFPANIYHYQKAKRKGDYQMITLLRLPLQLVLIFWVYTYL